MANPHPKSNGKTKQSFFTQKNLGFWNLIKDKLRSIDSQKTNELQVRTVRVYRKRQECFSFIHTTITLTTPTQDA